MTIGLLDLGIITNRVIEVLDTCTEPRFVTYSGLAPDVARHKEHGCSVSVYLMHVSADKFHRNTFPTGGPAQQVPAQPLGLTLYYLITAYAKDNYRDEQRAMSIVLKCLHEHPILTADITNTERVQEFTITLEPQSIDEVGRIWQALTKSFRLSAVYRASVIFLQPPDPPGIQAVRHMPTFDSKNVNILTQPPAAPGVQLDVDPTGFAEMTNADFVTGRTTVVLRALPLIETAAMPIPARRFKVVPPKLQFRVPLFTPAGTYSVAVTPTPTKPVIDVTLNIPKPIVTAPADSQGFVAIAIDDARFTPGATTCELAGKALNETTATTPLRGQFHLDPVVPPNVDTDVLVLRIPAVLGTGRYPLVLKATPAAPYQTVWTVWIEVP